MQTSPSHQSTGSFYWPALLLATLGLWLRTDHLNHFAARHLWAEDGRVFISQAHALGWHSLLEPYSSYLHLYPRMVSLLANPLPLTDRPTVLLIGWLLAYYFMSFCAARLIRHMGGSPLHAAITVFLIAVQPNIGEVFFNVTNAQWHLGAALGFIAMTRSDCSSRTELIVLAVISLIAGLTGPFLIIVIAVVMFWLIPARRAWRGNWPIYACMAIAALVQAVHTIQKPRVSIHDFNFDPAVWTKGLWRFVSMGANNGLGYVLILVLLGCYVYLIFTSKGNRIKHLTALGLLFIGLGMGAAGMYAQFPDPLGAAARGLGQRYTWVPYAMVLASISVVSIGAHRVLTAVLALAAFLFCARQPLASKKDDLHFKSFAKLAEVTETVIPIHPVQPVYPSWNIHLPPQTPEQPTYRMKMPDQNLTDTFNTPNLSGSSIATGFSCKNARHIGVEMDMHRQQQGEVTLYWSDNERFGEQYKFGRWYPNGDIKAQFAFPAFPGNIFLHIDPHQQPPDATAIKALRIYCLN